MPNFIENPRYQRVIQRLQGMPSWKRAIFTSAGADRAFASESMRDKINALNAAATLEARKGRLELARKRLDISKDITRKSERFAERENLGANLLGVANIGVSGLLGWKQKDLLELQAQKTAEDRRKLLSAIRGLN